MEGNKNNQTPLSVAIITKNEQERLPDCLRSLSFADEILVVDSGSKDDTVDIAESFGARVLKEHWRGFSGQKQFAVDQCRNKWVLILDADERIPEKTAVTIKEEMNKSESPIAAFSFKRKNFLHDRWIKHSGWWPDRIVRLVDKRRGGFDGRPVHESWNALGLVQKLEACIEHISFRNYSELVAKMETYSNLAARDMLKNNRRAGPLTPLTHGFWMFIRTYFLELGMLDGFDGLVIAIMNAGGSFLKYAKLREMADFVGRKP